jgi:two-component system, chemotaxis family, chemotaxis protein CheY
MSTVLVVDDEEPIRTAVALVLQDAGYRVLSAGDGSEALERLDEEWPALILLDMRMPRMDGWTFASELRARHTRSVPIVVLTAARDAREQAEEIKADGFLSKPFDVQGLIDAVEQYATP